MTRQNKWVELGDSLIRLLALKSQPIGVKLIRDESEIPQNALRPYRDHGVHYAQCQAFTLSREESQTVAMLKEDHWCWGSLMSFGLVEFPEVTEEDLQTLGSMATVVESVMDPSKARPKIEVGESIGILSAPLCHTESEPDVILIYCNPARIRSILAAVIGINGPSLKTELDPYDSCAYAVISPMQTQKLTITIPDPGEYERALVDENMLIVSIPANKLEETVTRLKKADTARNGFHHHKRLIKGDFNHPPFYELFFKKWGLDNKDS